MRRNHRVIYSDMEEKLNKRGNELSNPDIV